MEQQTSHQHPLSEPRVLNKKKRPNLDNSVDISRSGPWGNPFRIGPDGGRDEVCDQFEKWVRHSPDSRARWIRKNIRLLIGKNLLCFCAPKRCHGDTLRRMAREAEEADRHRPGKEGGWVRISIPGNSDDSPPENFSIRVSDYSDEGIILEAAGSASWMIGKSCRRIGIWVQRNGGTTIRMDKIRELAAKLNHPSQYARRIAS